MENKEGSEFGVTQQVRPELTHDEQLRATALSLACRYYVETIVKDGDLYREMVRDNKVLKPATYMGVLEVSCAFELFLLGQLKRTADAVVESPNETKEVATVPAD